MFKSRRWQRLSWRCIQTFIRWSRFEVPANGTFLGGKQKWSNITAFVFHRNMTDFTALHSICDIKTLSALRFSTTLITWCSQRIIACLLLHHQPLHRTPFFVKLSFFLFSFLSFFLSKNQFYYNFTCRFVLLMWKAFTELRHSSLWLFKETHSI